MSLLVIVRHGQSLWNLENRFTGSVDIDLTSTGEKEAIQAGKKLRKFTVSCGFTSVLKRAIRTMDLILTEMGQQDIPVKRDAALNERSYGDLQGMNKAEMELRYGAQQVLDWRRGFDAIPPNGESLKNTLDRIIPYYQRDIEPELKSGKNVIVVAHGNSLRALMMSLEGIGREEITNVTLATGIPRLYSFDESQTLIRCWYLE